MSDFCKQCSERLFGRDFEDLKGLTTQREWDNNFAAVALCEGCGYIQVDPEGRCTSKDCLDPNHDGEDIVGSVAMRTFTLSQSDYDELVEYFGERIDTDLEATYDALKTEDDPVVRKDVEDFRDHLEKVLGPIRNQLTTPSNVKTYIIAHDEYMGEEGDMSQYKGTWRQLLEYLNDYWTIDAEYPPEENYTDDQLVELFKKANDDGQPFYMVWCVEDGKRVI